MNRMRLYSWNVNGIRAVLNKGALQSFIAKHDPDILCLQETKAERGQVEIDLPQYQEHFYSAVKKGYSGTAIFSKIAPIGYADGLPRSLSSRGAAYWNGIRLPIAGRVSMDSIILDITALPEGTLKLGDRVEIIGQHQTLEQIAADAGTISYEILTSLGARYRRVYRNALPVSA